MSDPLVCLRNSTIGIAIWNIIYSVIQMGVMGWQVKEVRDRQWEYEGPMFVIVLINVFLAFVHFFMSFSLLYGAIKYNKNFIWPWIFSAGPIIIMSTAYAVLWWSGDVFNEQLTMSVAEFVMSLAVNGICLVVVIFYYYRLAGKLTSDKPARPHSRGIGTHPHDHHPRGPKVLQPVNGHHSRGPHCEPPPSNLPPWREEWPSIPDVQLQRKMRRRDRRSRSHPRVTSIHRQGDESSLDFFAPEPYDEEFPWKATKLEKQRRKELARPHTAAEAIERMYYNKYPDDLPGIPKGMRSSLRRDRKSGRSPDRVKFSRADPEINYRTPQDSVV
ncbi:hypothetical protein OESDEN_12861 [Oesophagostomum dentatum]|uniref:DUF7027 domain-containing protein n=1 Tax=Oesophagostomum dentatum TaxID=61180 RepID=A0A0B1SUZ9_OESDE|nr:hypothetical protein OESDEN_12861 [Oesophagostomum dentatum]